MADPNFETMSAEQQAVVLAAVEWAAAELNFKKPSGERSVPAGGGDVDAHAQNRLRGAEVGLRHAVAAYNAL